MLVYSCHPCSPFEGAKEAGRVEALGQRTVGSAQAAQSASSGPSRKMLLRRARYQLTYAELEERVRLLAGELRLRGLSFSQGEALVAICLERTVALAVALLGVLTAGAATLYERI